MHQEKLLPSPVEPKQLPAPPAPKKRLHWWYLLMVMLLAVAALLLAGYLPRQRRETAIHQAATEERNRVPVAHVTRVRRAPERLDLLLPGNITPLTEASLYARAAGYVARRHADIGDHVRSGQVLAEIDTPELDQQVDQARAAVAQSRQQAAQSHAEVENMRTQQELARVTFERYRALLGKGAVARQEYDQQEAGFRAAQARVRSAEANAGAAGENIRSAEANLNRLAALQGFKLVRAPFDGVITARNFDVGALTGGGGNSNGELYRVAQVSRLRILVNVPQANTPDIRVGQAASVRVQEFAGQSFDGRITRTALALDPAARTMLTEVQVENPRRMLLPGMYAQVLLSNQRSAPPLLVPGDSIIADARGMQVAILGDGGPEGSPPDGKRIHLRAVQVGRDYGPEIEVVSGLEGWEFVVVNPGDEIEEGTLVRPQAAPTEPGQRQGKAGAKAR